MGGVTGDFDMKLQNFIWKHKSLNSRPATITKDYLDNMDLCELCEFDSCIQTIESMKHTCAIQNAYEVIDALIEEIL